MYTFDSPKEGDRSSSQGSGLPPFKVLNYRSGKTAEMVAKHFQPDAAKTYFEANDVGFAYYDKEHAGTVPVKNGVFALLGTYWKLGTFTGNDKDAIRYSSNIVLNIRDDKMRVYANGEATSHEGTYNELKSKAIWGQETKVSLFWLMLELTTDRLYAVEMTNAVKNGFKTAVMKAYGKPITPQSIEKENLFGLSDSPDNFHSFSFHGVEVCDVSGMPYKGKKEAYFIPQFNCGIIRREKHPEIAEKLQSARDSFFGVIRSRLTPSAPATSSTTSHGATQSDPGNLPDPLDALKKAGWHEEPEKDPFGGDGLPF